MFGTVWLGACASEEDAIAKAAALTPEQVTLHMDEVRTRAFYGVEVLHVALEAHVRDGPNDLEDEEHCLLLRHERAELPLDPCAHMVILHPGDGTTFPVELRRLMDFIGLRPHDPITQQLLATFLMMRKA